MNLKIGQLVFEGSAMGKLRLVRVLARLTKIKKNYGAARLETLLSPRCKHFGPEGDRCGGCAFQFLSYEDQLKWKEQFVRDAITHIAGISSPSIQSIIGCSSPWFYRNKMEYSFAWGKLGLHPRGRFQEVFDLQECFLESELSVKIVNAVREWTKKIRQNIFRNLAVREGKNTKEFLVNLLITDSPFEAEEDFKNFMIQNFPEITSLYLTTVTAKKGFRTLMKEKLIFGKPTLQEKLHVPTKVGVISLEFEIAPQAFFQPNTSQAEVLYGKVLEFAEPQKSDIVYDLFCGTGTIGMFFAKMVKKVYGIDVSESAIRSARQNAEHNRLSNIEFLSGDVGKLIFSLPQKPSIVIVDPPRAGIAQKTLQKILELSPPKIIYVSCNPTTLAHDLKELSAKYSFKTIQPIDLFPQTYHVETVTELNKV